MGIIFAKPSNLKIETARRRPYTSSDFCWARGRRDWPKGRPGPPAKVLNTNREAGGLPICTASECRRVVDGYWMFATSWYQQIMLATWPDIIKLLTDAITVYTAKGPTPTFKAADYWWVTFLERMPNALPIVTIVCRCIVLG